MVDIVCTALHAFYTLHGQACMLDTSIDAQEGRMRLLCWRLFLTWTDLPELLCGVGAEPVMILLYVV